MSERGGRSGERGRALPARPPHRAEDEPQSALPGWPVATANATPPPAGGRQSLIASFRAAGGGLTLAWRRGRNLRVQSACGFAALVLGWWLGLPAAEGAALVLAAGLVLASEVLNTAVEALVDLITREYHPLARAAKDLAAGAVLVLAVTAVGVAAWEIVPRLGDLAPALAARWQGAPAAVVLPVLVEVGLVLAAIAPPNRRLLRLGTSLPPVPSRPPQFRRPPPRQERQDPFERPGAAPPATADEPERARRAARP